MYPILLATHSWIRWIIVLSAIIVIIKSWRGTSKSLSYVTQDRILANVFFWAINIQFLIGLALYIFFSPVTRVAFGDLSAAMSDASLRFFLIEHPLAMFLAIGSAHSFLKKAKKENDGVKKHGIMFKGVGISFFFILIGIPWPFLPYGRSLFFM